MARIINATLDMYSNQIINAVIESVPELPEAADEGRYVYLPVTGEIFVMNGGAWRSAGQVNILEGITVNGEPVPITDRVSDIEVPTKVSQLENDAGYLTPESANLANYYTKAEVYNKSEVDTTVKGLDRRINAIRQFNLKVVDALPTEDISDTTIYLVPAGTGKKRSNIRDEYIWVEGAWEQIGSTEFTLSIVQDATGVSINGTSLQTADATRAGLMTPAHVASLEGKQDRLKAGANIVIAEDNTISAVGGAGGGTGTKVVEFTATAGEATRIVHNLSSYDLVFRMRTVTAPIRYIDASVTAVDEDTLEITTEIDGTFSISIVSCGGTPTPSGTVDTQMFASLTQWSMSNNTAKPKAVQVYDESGEQIMGDVMQESASGFTPITVDFGTTPMSGTMVAAEATMVKEFTGTEWKVEDLDGYYFIQTYVDGEGDIGGDIIQDGSSVTVTFGESKTGYMVLVKPTEEQTFTDERNWAVTHGQNRCVLVQAYDPDVGAMIVQAKCITPDVVQISHNIPRSGHVLIV